ncbi:unnamed protein product [Polarella glacialis]|uniref:Secreted protein n=1 Tax=Polarella glacialis TaxID=89957 RepID=A0A813LIX8_POLGL|nr:unnamed protein product [Polarella glacialis]
MPFGRVLFAYCGCCCCRCCCIVFVVGVQSCYGAVRPCTTVYRVQAVQYASDSGLFLWQMTSSWRFEHLPQFCHISALGPGKELFRHTYSLRQFAETSDKVKGGGVFLCCVYRL